MAPPHPPTPADDDTAIAATRQAWRPGGVPALLLDATVAVAAAAAAMAAMALSDEPTARSPDAVAYALLLAAAAPLVARRSWPAAALLATSAVTLVYFMLGYPGGPPTVILLAAIYGAAAVGRRWWALGVTVAFAGGGLAYRALVEQEALVGVLLNSALFVLVLLLGETVYSRRALRAEIAERLRRAADERERQAQQRVIEERMRIARELHDVMAHTVATMTVQAGVAADSIDARPDHARAALHALRGAAREATAELRATVAVLRGGRDGSPPPPSPGLADVDELLETARLGGVDVHLRTSCDAGALPTAVEVTLFRVIQEALTNVVRHAQATTATVSIRCGSDGLDVIIDDDGRGVTAPLTEGYGLVGIRERAEALGGWADAGPGPAGGFRVHARLPIIQASR